MKLTLPFLKKKEVFPEQFFALDLGGKNLKVFLLSCAGNSVVPIGSRKLSRSDSLEEDAFNLKEATSQLRTDFPEASSLAIAGLSGPYTSAFTTVVRSSTSRDVQDLVSHAREEARRSAEVELRRGLGDPRLKVSEVEAEVLEVKEADKLEVFLFTSFAVESYLNELSQLIRASGLELWGFSSIPFNLVTELARSAAATDHKEQLNALIFDIGGSKTEVSLAFGGELMDTKSFWWEFQENGNPAAFLDLWLEAVSTVLTEFEGVEGFPAKIYLAGGAAAFPGLLEVVASYPWSRDHPFEVAPEVVPLEEDRISASLGQVALRLRREAEIKITKDEKEEEEDFGSEEEGGEE